MADICTNCKKSADADTPLKRCAKCKSECYCSRDCQKFHWKIHKKVCSSNASTSSTSAAGSILNKPFHRLDNKTWLHDRPEEETYKLLIDTYRMRVEDRYKFEGEADVDSIYGGAASGVGGFRRFMKLVQSRPGLLPAWWSAEKAAACEDLGKRGGWSSLSSAVEKSAVIEEYGDRSMPMQLRMFGEQVYGSGPGGQSGVAMLAQMKMVESGGIQSSFMGI